MNTSRVQGPLEEVIDLFFFFYFSPLRLALQPTQEWPALLLIVQMLLRFVMIVAKKKYTHEIINDLNHFLGLQQFLYTAVKPIFRTSTSRWTLNE